MKLIILTFVFYNILLNASNYIAKGVILDNGKWLIEENIHIEHPLADLTKLMSALVLMEEIEKSNISLEDTFSVHRNSIGIAGNSISLRSGEKVKLKDLIYGCLIQSANNATYAMAYYLSQNEDDFVKLMNNKARELGMKNTVFHTPSGLPSIMTKKGMDTSTIEDLAILCLYILNKPSMMNILSLREYSIKNNSLKLSNTNKSLLIDGVDGLKIGSHESAAYNFAISVENNNLRYILLLLGSKSLEEGEKEIKRTIQKISDNYIKRDLIHKDEFLVEVPILNAKKRKLNLYAKEGARHIIRKDIPLTKSVYLPKKIEAPIKKNQVIGIYTISYENIELARIELVSKENIERTNWLQRLINRIKN